MKKIIAMAMVLVMMLAVAVPAFAETIDQNTLNKSVDAIVSVNPDSIEEADENWSVTVPATVEFGWNESAKALEVSAKTNSLMLNRQLTVTAKEGAMMTAQGVADKTLNFTATFAGITLEPVAEKSENLIVEVTNWDEVPVAAYGGGTITFTAAVSDVAGA